jgi:uncharacterized protein YjbJ (UPF0337 family)
MWNKDEIKGKGKQMSGAIKDKAGELIRNPKLEAKGEAERVAGKTSGEERESAPENRSCGAKGRQGDCRQTLVRE